MTYPFNDVWFWLWVIAMCSFLVVAACWVVVVRLNIRQRAELSRWTNATIRGRH